MTGKGSDERLLELKVGALVLVALALLVTFILILGDWTLESQKDISVHFQNPGGLTPGASVKVAGRKVGTIREMTFLGQTGPRNPLTGVPALVRARISVNEDVADALREDVKFYVTSKGVLGDPFLEIEPGLETAPMDPEKPMFGIDPPRLDLFVADAYELVKALNGLIARNSKNLDNILGGGARIMGAVESLVDGGVESERFEGIIGNMEGLLKETRELVTGAKTRYVDDPKVERILRNVDSLTSTLDKEIDPLLKEVKTAIASVNRLSQTIGPDEQKKIKEAIAKLDGIMTRTDRMVVSVKQMVDRVRHGEGTVGQLMTDEEIYDDLKELIRDIKKHPWKIIWQE